MSTVSTRSERSHSRRRVGSLRCEAVRAGDFSLVGRQVLDWSEGGMRVELERGVLSATPLHVGERVWISFYAEQVAMWFDMEAEVARVSQARRRGEQGQPSVGLRFLQRWDAGRAEAMPLTRLLLRGGMVRLSNLPAPRGARGRRSAGPVSARRGQELAS